MALPRPPVGPLWPWVHGPPQKKLSWAEPLIYPSVAESGAGSGAGAESGEDPGVGSGLWVGSGAGSEADVGADFGAGPETGADLGKTRHWSGLGKNWSVPRKNCSGLRRNWHSSKVNEPLLFSRSVHLWASGGRLEMWLRWQWTEMDPFSPDGKA